MAQGFLQGPQACGAGIYHDCGRSLQRLEISSYVSSFQQCNAAAPAATVSRQPKANASEASFERLELFVTSFPGGFWELNNTLFRSLRFFWPVGEYDFNLCVVLDNTGNATANHAHEQTVLG